MNHGLDLSNWKMAWLPQTNGLTKAVLNLLPAAKSLKIKWSFQADGANIFKNLIISYLVS